MTALANVKGILIADVPIGAPTAYLEVRAPGPVHLEDAEHLREVYREWARLVALHDIVVHPSPY